MVEDGFLNLTRQPRKSAVVSGDHSQRAHSKFSASGAERWLECPGSVPLSEGLPDKSNVWAEEGTRAHEVLEKIILHDIKNGSVETSGAYDDMWQHGYRAATFITDLWRSMPKSEVLVETRIYLDFIHPEMFGTFDGAVVDHWGTLHVFDYKYGAGVSVSVRENLQMIFYGLGLAARYHWDFKRVRLWIIQPRIKGYDGPTFWETSMQELKAYIDVFRRGVERVLKVTGRNEDYREGSWCHFCKCKSICPLKKERKLGNAIEIFRLAPV